MQSKHQHKKFFKKSLLQSQMLIMWDEFVDQLLSSLTFKKKTLLQDQQILCFFSNIYTQVETTTIVHPQLHEV